jgi:hypothetical protein
VLGAAAAEAALMIERMGGAQDLALPSDFWGQSETQPGGQL